MATGVVLLVVVRVDTAGGGRAERRPVAGGLVLLRAAADALVALAGLVALVACSHILIVLSDRGKSVLMKSDSFVKHSSSLVCAVQVR